MPPRILAENSVRVFKFWFGNSLRDGLHHGSELYFLSQTRSIQNRTRLYRLAHSLAFRGADVLVTVSQSHCRLWIGLRNQKLAIEDLERHAPKTSTLAQDAHGAVLGSN